MTELPEIVELKGYRPQPGDVLFIRTDEEIPVKVANDLVEFFKDHLPGVACIVLHGLTVLAPAPEENTPQ